jgi:hypothetical protein
MKICRRELKRLVMMTGIVLSAIGSGAVTPANALTFNFIAGTGITTTSQQYLGFQEAGSLWSTLFTDPVTLNIKINFTNIGAGSLGFTSLASGYYDYSDVYAALNTDKTSTDDNTAVASLSSSGAYQKRTNYTSDNPNGAGSTTTYVTSGDRVAMTTANAKALNLITTAPIDPLTNQPIVDATISLNDTGYSWDYGVNIAAGHYDFVGVAAHEIGHVLGFNSAVDALDASGGLLKASDYSLVPLDLFRYSTESKDLSAVDFSVGTTDKYFSLDGGTKIVSFATGVNNGDGRQAQHWQEVSNSLGIMDPATAAGELLQFTINDIRAFDAVGWDRSAVSFAAFNTPATAVPEPENYLGTFICTAFGVVTLVRHKRKLARSLAEPLCEGKRYANGTRIAISVSQAD